MPRCLSKFPEWRVSSAITPSQASSTRRARSVMSPRFPIGVATTCRGTLPPRVEGVLEVGQCGPCGAVHDRDHVEPGRLRRAPALREEVAGRRDHPPLLARVDRFLGAPECRSGPGAHLDEHQQLALLGDEVDLATPAAMVPGDDAVPTLAQGLCRHVLPERAQAQRHACRTRSAVPGGGASGRRWITCVCVPIPLSILPISARLGPSRTPKASSITMGSRLYPETRSSRARRTATYTRSRSGGGSVMWSRCDRPRRRGRAFPCHRACRRP